jgi:2-oxoisovalerate ferredoxin oxidoreductase beta subunit
VIIHEDLVEADPSLNGIRHLRFPATRIAADAGLAKAANTAMLGALFGLGGMPGISKEGVLDCVSAGLAKKPELVAKNVEVFEAALAYCRREFPGVDLRTAAEAREPVLA